ncbi:hypothetical protein LCGC14_1963380 [marine sediment metagenome]|uniref:Uncharacterized protein n=1 Tax=marine sediment metagenome TaxID=412755 RepID=A0A0F9FE87_9ZZZZ
MKRKSAITGSANLVRAVGAFVACRQECEGCPLHNPVNEWSEHPTYCEMLTEIEQNYTVGR